MVNIKAYTRKKKKEKLFSKEQHRSQKKKICVVSRSCWSNLSPFLDALCRRRHHHKFVIWEEFEKKFKSSRLPFNNTT